ncbi:hypothetical protein FBZ83_107229 [Azospirillum brasilense]|uniref:Uncharacterized protein n=1 Tax=Azospirillum brasilense TaxID=192 RepID=A0A560CCF6_AZOBR|nr:hypothetical protein FBZ83_107229 [Azospirillum brasilense]
MKGKKGPHFFLVLRFWRWEVTIIISRYPQGGR